MKKIIFSIVFCISLFRGYSQEIGQNAEYVKWAIELQTKQHNQPDNFGNISNSHWTWSVNYFDGKIESVIQCYQHQYVLDLGLFADYCKIFVMKEGKLAYILTQFENVSTQKLIENYERKYNGQKVGKYYFSSDYQTFYKVYLAKNGMGTVEIRKTEINNFPKNIKYEVDRRMKLFNKNKDLDTRNQTEQKEKSEIQQSTSISESITQNTIYSESELDSKISLINESEIDSLLDIQMIQLYNDRKMTPEYGIDYYKISYKLEISITDSGEIIKIDSSPKENKFYSSNDGQEIIINPNFIKCMRFNSAKHDGKKVNTTITYKYEKVYDLSANTFELDTDGNIIQYIENGGHIVKKTENRNSKNYIELSKRITKKGKYHINSLSRIVGIIQDYGTTFPVKELVQIIQIRKNPFI